MKVKELQSLLSTLDPEAEIGIALRKGYRPYGYVQPIRAVEVTHELETNRIYCLFDVNIDEALK